MSATSPFVEVLSQFERLVPFWQLRLVYGLEFWSNLHRRYRDPATRPEMSDDESRRQAFIVEAFRVAGYDLRTFLSGWGLKPSAQTDQALQALRLPPANVAALMAVRP